MAARTDELPMSLTETFLPVLRLRGKSVLVAGGGAEAALVAAGLLRAGAGVTLVAPELEAAAAALVKGGQARHHAREFSARDLEGIFLAVAADEPVVSGLVAEAARAAGVLFADLHHPDAGDIRLAPAVALGGATLAADAAAFALSAPLMRRAAAGLGPVANELITLIERVAGPLLAGAAPDYQARIFQSLLDSDLATLLQKGETAKAEAKALRIVGQTTRVVG